MILPERVSYRVLHASLSLSWWDFPSWTFLMSLCTISTVVLCSLISMKPLDCTLSWIRFDSSFYRDLITLSPFDISMTAWGNSCWYCCHTKDMNGSLYSSTSSFRTCWSWSSESSYWPAFYRICIRSWEISPYNFPLYSRYLTFCWVSSRSLPL